MIHIKSHFIIISIDLSWTGQKDLRPIYLGPIQSEAQTPSLAILLATYPSTTRVVHGACKAGSNEPQRLFARSRNKLFGGYTSHDFVTQTTAFKAPTVTFWSSTISGAVYGKYNSPRFHHTKNQSFPKIYHGCQRCQLTDTKWSSYSSLRWYDIFTFSCGYTREEPIQIVPLQERPLQGALRPTETPEDATPTGALVRNLLRTVQRQTSLIDEHNRHLMDLEQARLLVRTKRTPSPTPNRRGRNPHQSRSRSPWHSVSITSPSHTRRSARRRSPRRSPLRQSSPRRSTTRRNKHSWSPSSTEDNRDA